MNIIDIIDSLPHIPNQSYSDFKRRLKRELKKRGLEFFPASYDSEGNCKVCGEAGRCSGLHLIEERK